MNISLTKRKYLLYLTILTLLLSGVGGVTYFSLVPEHYFGGYPLIPIYFYIFGVFNIYMFDACRRFAPDKILLLHLAMKVLKMILSVIVLVVYCMVVREEAVAFMLTFIVYYLLYLIFETSFFAGYELNKKRQKKNKTKMKQLHNIFTGLLLILGLLIASPAVAQEDDITPQEQKENTVEVKSIVFGHIGDSYEWHITTWGDTHITIPLPVIVYSSNSGWHSFLSSRLEENGGTYEGFSIAPAGSRYEGKIIEHDAAGEEIRPWIFLLLKLL